MNCDWIKENVVLYIYGELADDARYEFEQHTRNCLSCRQEVESALSFKEEMSEPVQEVSPNLLVASRLRLQEALEETVQSRGWHRFIFDLSGWLQQVKLAPALMAAMLIIGFAGGSLTTWRLLAVQENPNIPPNPDKISTADIAGIESITPDTNSNKVAIKYDVVTPQTLEGSPEDPRIQQLLLMASRNTANSGVRLDSIDLLTRKAEDNAVREALIYALRYDKNPGVRLKALDGLKSYVKDDVHVRDAIVEALMHDTNAGVRAEAIVILDPVRGDMSVREALQMLAEHDKDQFIRAESKRYLESTPRMY